MMIFIWSLTYLLLSVTIYCLARRKWLLAILMALFLIALIIMGEQYKKSITLVKIELLNQHIMLTYKNQKTKLIDYHEIKDVRHYCEGKSAGRYGVALYVPDQRIEVQHGGRIEEAKTLKAQLFAKMNHSN